MKPNMGKAVLGGVLGTILMTLMMFFIAPQLLGHPMDIASDLAKFIGGPWILGMIIHVGLGAAVFPVIYVALLFGFLTGAPWLRGLQWGVVLWIATMTVVMPVLGHGFFMSQGGGVKAVMAALMVHCVYGAVLGAVAGGSPGAHARSAT